MADDDLRRLAQMPGVIAYCVINAKGVPIKTHNMDTPRAIQISTLLGHLADDVQDFLCPDPQPNKDEDDLKALRLRTTKQEILVIPGPRTIEIPVTKDKDGKPVNGPAIVTNSFTLIIIQSTTGLSKEEIEHAEALNIAANSNANSAPNTMTKTANAPVESPEV